MARPRKADATPVDAPLPNNVVDNPILNSPFDEPSQYWDFSGATATIVSGRRPAGYSGVARSEAMKDASQAELAQLDLKLANAIRQRVREWRERRWPGVTRITRDLLEHWNRADRRPIFFCQREAAETIIWLTEASPADLQGITVPLDEPVDAESKQKGYGPLLRYCTKMATGSGKTTVMAMLAAWQLLNRAASKSDGRFCNAVLVVAPNLTVKDRLQVLKPGVPGSYYEKFDLVPPGLRGMMKSHQLHITNWHVFGVKDDRGKRGIVQRGRESDAAFVRRVLEPLGRPQQVFVMNDEAHHAWRPVPPEAPDAVQEELLDRDDKKEAEDNVEEATIWVGGLDKINKVLGKGSQRGIKMVIDVSATPFALKGSGRREGTPLPWIVSDFSLSEAIESGITKVPRIPIRDDSGRPDPQYYRLWDKVVATLKEKGEITGKRPKPEAVWREVQPAFVQLAGKWKATFDEFARAGQPVPPAIIVVGANTDIASEIERRIKGGEAMAELAGDVTYRVDSRVLADAEDGEAGTTKAQEAQLLRLKTATVGKAQWEGGSIPASAQNFPDEVRAKLATPPGRDVRCVVSVAMLTEGWDAQNVTQILGVRAFGSQLLCEQVAGRALRRMSYDIDPVTRRLQPEYADIFGVPFQAMPVQGTGTGPPRPGPETTLVEPVEARKHLAIEFPRVEGYIVDVKERIRCDVEAIPTLSVHPQFETMQTTVAPTLSVDGSKKLVGAVASAQETLTREAYYAEQRVQRTAFGIAAEIVRAMGDGRAGLFPQVLGYVEELIEKRVVLVRGARLEEIALAKYRDVIVKRLADAIEPDDEAGERPLLPRLVRYQPIGSTAIDAFRTTKKCWPTVRSHISHVTFDSTYEGTAAFHLESDALADVVIAYAKNERLDFTIPYEIGGGLLDGAKQGRSYVPDFLIRLRMDDGGETTVVLETKGRLTEHAKEKESAARRWVRAVNHHGGLGRWDFVQVQEPADIPEALRKLAHAPTFAPGPIPRVVEVDDRIARVVEGPDEERRSEQLIRNQQVTLRDDWVAATRVRSFMLGDPLLDWLDLFGAEKGFERDDAVKGYSRLTDFMRFIFGKQQEFEAGVLRLIKERADVEAIAGPARDVRNPEAAAATLRAMDARREVIWQGVLHEPDTRIYGSPDMLVRSDVLERLFPGVYADEQPAGEVPEHYRVVDVKFTTLDLLKSGELDNSGSCRAYKAQLYLYNRALGRLRGFLAPRSFLLGRSWRDGKAKGSSCLERLGPVSQATVLGKDEVLRDVVDEAVAWVRKVQRFGAQWDVWDERRLPELRPNMKNTLDAPWHGAKKKIAAATKEPTAMWQIGPDRRDTLSRAGIVRWDDPALTAERAGIKGPKTAPVLDAMLAVNRGDGAPVRPAKVTADQAEWRAPKSVEFFVDFETVSDLGDDLSRLPERGGDAVIYMVGCGHIEGGAWKFECFVVDALDEASEGRMLDAWFAHMRSVGDTLGQTGAPRVYHWSPAEMSNLETAANAARKRHADKDWPALDAYDFLNRVVKAEPFVVRGALGFGLKAIGKALHGLGLIGTAWTDGPTDGLGAMVAAWSAHEQVRLKGAPLRAAPVMADVVTYNEVDCRVMYEVIDYIRRVH